MNRPQGMPDLDTIPDEQFEKMGINREDLGKLQEAMQNREKNAPKVGELAQDFELKRLSPEGKLTEERVKLSSLRGQTVALVFASYT